jgi:hypothetical protein
MKRIAALISAFFLLAVSCQFPGDLAGGSASEGEARVVGWAIGKDGSRAADAQVKVRPAGYLKDTSASSILAFGGRIRDLRTDSSGTFVIDTLDTGAYAITIFDRPSFSSLLRCHITKDTSLGYTTLMPSGTITGSIDPFSEKSMYRYVQVYDIECASPIDSLTGEFILHDIPQGTYSLRLLAASDDMQPEVLKSVQVVAGARAMVQTGAWTHAARIFLNTTSDGAGVNDGVYDFPVLVRLTGNNFNFSQAGSLGADIRFAKSDGVPLSFEIERWDSSSIAAAIWVRMDTVLGNNDKQYFLMYWGNPHSTASSSSASVFDTAKGFQGVWHFGSIRNGTCEDATQNGYQGSLSAVVPAQGVIGAAYLFDGLSSHITLAQTAASTLNFPQGGAYAISAWVNAGDSLLGAQSIVAKGYAQYTLRISDGQWQFFESEGRVPMECETSQAPATYGEWVHLVAVRNGANQYLYVNGACVDSAIDYVQGIGGRIEMYDVEIGRTVFPDSDTTPREYFNGLLDEVRLSTFVPSRGWIKLCYMNQRTNDALTDIER